MVLAVSTFTFFIVHAIPGNPVDTRVAQLVQQGMTYTQARAQVQAMYGFLPRQPLMLQYFSYVARLFRFDLGVSITYTGVPVSHLLLQALPWTVILVFIGILISFFLGMIAGVLAAVYRDSRTGNGITLFSTLLHGVPQFMVALLLAFLFGTVWHLLPLSAPYSVEISPGLTPAFIGSLVRHAILPVSAYVISGYGGWALTMKSSVVSVLGDDFILAAELRGLSPKTRLSYIAKNAILPLFTILALSIGFMFGGAVFIEDIFDYPGLGHLLLSSVNGLDYPLMEGAFLLITIGVIVSNMIADFLYTAIDPRIRE